MFPQRPQPEDDPRRRPPRRRAAIAAGGLATAIAVVLLVPVTVPAATLFQRDDFASGTTEGWAGGAAPTVESDGGPGGPGDAFLRIGNGGSLATYNRGAAWSGSFSAAGITAVTADLMAPADNPVPLEIRLVVLGPGTDTRWTSLTARPVPSDGTWRSYSFSLAEADLVRIAGTATLAESLAAVDRIQFRHDPDPPMPGGESVPGFLGLDNITSIPEPAPAALVIAGALLATLARQRPPRPRPSP